MPLVRIDVRKGKDVAYRQEIGRVVYEALVGVGVPKDDRFQVISEYDAAEAGHRRKSRQAFRRRAADSKGLLARCGAL